jgi:alkanesulfonate monooxygenase SsuD/methylene tetrahydromethanopterin reductase-like flavin-dependent oxidoreductase (luciferase family)
MRLGMSLRGLGYHIAAWRHPQVPADGTLRFDHYLRNARAAERGLFDMIFFADGIGIREMDEPRGSLARSGYEIVELEPMTLLPALAALTRNIGLVTTASTTYNEPYHVARKFATLDVISNGRAGWNVVTSWSEAEARNFNRDSHLDYDTRYERATEFVEVVTGLWDACARPPGSAFQGARPAERRRHAAGQAGAGAGGCLRPGAGDRRGDRRCGLCRAGYAGGGEGLLRRHQGPHAALRPRSGSSEDPARCPYRSRPHPGGGAGEIR